jgi:hypothetical protein
MPKRFDKAYKKQMGSIKGVWNAIEGRPMADEHSINHQIGQGAWEGYKVGYEKGRGYKLEISVSVKKRWLQSSPEKCCLMNLAAIT